MLDTKSFKAVVENTPLVSIDLCLVCNDKILLGKRHNEPLKGQWFTPGGRIHKNETWQEALLRIAEVELGLISLAVEDFSLMGVWDHLYNNSAVDPGISTHYVNLPHYAWFKSKPEITLDEQHAEFEWFDLSMVADNQKFHLFMRTYSSWLLKQLGSSND